MATSPAAPGWVYVMVHPAWDKLGMVKIGRTGRDPRTRAAEVTAVSGLLAPCTIASCAPVSDMAAAEAAVHRMLADRRVRKRRELFRVDAATARRVVEMVAASLPSHSPLASIARWTFPAHRSADTRYRHTLRRPGSWRHGRRRVLSLPVRLLAGVAAISALVVLLRPVLPF